MSGATPYAKTKQMLEKEGYLVGRTEHWNSFVHIRQDLFGIIDMVCIRDGEKGVLAAQPTSGDHVSDHMRKAFDNTVLPVWLKAGNRFEIHGWRKIGERGKRKLWACRKIRFSVPENQQGQMIAIDEGGVVQLRDGTRILAQQPFQEEQPIV